MKIGCITISFNDDYKFDQWCSYYEEYKDELYKHVIVDNGSTPDFLSRVKGYFTNSIIIERGENGGCTGGYNTGLTEVLKDGEVDSIMLIGNDLRLPSGNLTKLHKALFSREDLGMVAPVVLKNGSDDEIENFGFSVSKYIKDPTAYIPGKTLGDLKDSFEYVDYVLGGMNLAKREFYEKVGLQDEKLFMYHDEYDMYMRAAKLGIKEGVTADAIAWHNHIRSPHPTAPAILNIIAWRNRLYIKLKHNGKFRAYWWFLYWLGRHSVSYLLHLRDKEYRKRYYSILKGFYLALIGNMNNDFVR